MKLPKKLNDLISGISMSDATREQLKDLLVRINETRQSLRAQAGLSATQRLLIKAYLKSPYKVQYLLAKFGVRMVVNKKKQELEEILRH